MSVQDILIPCRRFDVEVTLGAHDGLSLTEQYLLRGMALGVRDLASLASTFGLPPRMVQDAVIDLLTRGLVDATTDGVLAAHPSVLEALGDPTMPRRNWYLPFQSADLPEPRWVTLTQDLVAGEVFATRKPGRAERPNLPTLPENASIGEVDDLPLGTLLTAVTYAMRSPEPTVDNRRSEAPQFSADTRILHVRLKRSGPSGGPSNHIDSRFMLLPAVIDARTRDDDEPPQITILGPTSLTPHVRRAIESTLDDLWLRGFGRSSQQFYDRLRCSSRVSVAANASDVSLAPQHAMKTFGELLASETPPRESHPKLVELDQATRPFLELHAQHACVTELVLGGASAFSDLLFDALKSAQQQVVMACPWIRQIGRSRALQAALREAIERGVTIVVLWGITSEKFPSHDPALAALAALEETAREALGSLVVAKHGATSHAKLLIVDGDWAVVSSCNFLNNDRDRVTREVGVRLSRGESRVMPLTIQRLLGWVRQHIPDYLFRERCVDSPALLGLTESSFSFPIGSQILSPQIDLGNLGVDVWRGAWKRREAELGLLMTRSLSAAMPVFDARHRELLVRAIATAQRRLLVASHRVTVYGLSEYLLEGILAAALRGVQVRLCYDAAEQAEMDPIASARLDRAHRSGASVSATDTHAKVLLCDDWAVVSSHNFLSLDPGERSAHEVGVQLFETEAVDALWASFGVGAGEKTPA